MGATSGRRVENMFCDRCGLPFSPRHSVCSRCGATPSHYWIQLISLFVLLEAVTCNSLVALLLLPQMTSGPHVRWMFRGWLWLDQQASFYGWVPIALALLAWDYSVRKGRKPKVRGWLTRKLLTLVLVAGIAPVLPWWVPAGQPPREFMRLIGKYAGVPAALAWGAIAFVATLLCIDTDTRDRLLGDGKVLSLVSLGAILLVLGMTLFGWAITS